MLLLLSELKVDNVCIPFSFQWEETVVEGSFKRRKKSGHVTLILETNVLPFLRYYYERLLKLLKLILLHRWGRTERSQVQSKTLFLENLPFLDLLGVSQCTYKKSLDKITIAITVVMLL